MNMRSVAAKITSFCALGSRRTPRYPITDDDREAFADLKSAGCSMSFSDVKAIRDGNKAEQEQFGDGRHEPRYPGAGDHRTLRRGVWVSDFGPTPTTSQLDEFREAYWATHEVVTYTLVEGEQDAPVGKDGEMIRVVARTINHDATGPSVYVGPVDRSVAAGSAWGTTYSPATLPNQMSVVVQKIASHD